ncbi:DUF1330 domain-containing protein [Mycobacteroides immunogenum]|uniref:DUF1330 domain-containing protein n=1 Tax=Mycobacteroides immunogenum TaxID=83262 RepID=UPI003F49B5F3
MTAYAIAQLRFTDLAAHHGYQARFLEVFRKFDGTLLAADESLRIVEGDSDREKVALMQFPGATSFHA